MKSMFSWLTVFIMSLGAITRTQAASVFQFAASTYGFAESAETASVTVQRRVDLNTLVSVDYATADGTATNGLKYTASSGTLVFGVGETDKIVAVPLLN